MFKFLSSPLYGRISAMPVTGYPTYSKQVDLFLQTVNIDMTRTGRFFLEITTVNETFYLFLMQLYPFYFPFFIVLYPLTLFFYNPLHP